MEKILDIITEKMERAFADAGYDASYGRVTVSNRQSGRASWRERG